MTEQTDGAPEPVILVVADISGYTRYMTANARTLLHSQTIITELVKAIVAQVQLPLEVAKLEGDAVFLYARKSSGQLDWTESKRLIGSKLFDFFETFQKKADELGQSTTCNCNACTHIEKLRLKLVVHSGEALFHQVFNFRELAGVDVIIVHRLLKNSVGSDQYLLMTEAARQDVEFGAAVELVQGLEDYQDIGRVKTWVYLADQTRPGAFVPEPFMARFTKSWTLFNKLLLAPLASTSRQRSFRHVHQGAGRTQRIGFAILTLMLMPFLFPVGAFSALAHALKPRDPASAAQHDHEHLPDGSCCKHKAPLETP
jgi:hypothetical protein